METDYWKSTEVQPDVDTWLSHWEGCLTCACDHGCNQWVKEQSARAALVMRAMRLGSAKRLLDKLVQIPLKRADKVWFWIHMRENKALNDALRDKDTLEAMNAKAKDLWKKRIQ